MMHLHKESESTENLPDRESLISVRNALLIVLSVVVFYLVKNFLPLGVISEGTDDQSVRVGLAILSAAAILWLSEALPLAITALLIPVLASLNGAMDVAESFAGFSHPLIFLFLGGFGLAAALTRQKLDQWLAMWILVFGRGRFYLTTSILFIVSALLSMWISNTAAVALLLPVALGLLKTISNQCGKSVAKQAAPYILLGLAYSASVGGLGTLIGSPPNAIAASQLGISFTQWLLIGIPCVLILLPTLFLLLRLLISPRVVPKFEVNTSRYTFSLSRILTLVVFLLAIGGWLFSNRLAQFFSIEKSFDSLVAIAAVLLLATLGLVRWKDIDNATDWGILLLFGGGITLSKVLGNTGASHYLAARIQELVAGFPLILIIGVVVTFVIFLTEISSNTASAALLVPIFAAVAVDIGVPEPQLVLPLTIAASCAFMLPIATPPNALVFASGQIAQSQMMRVGLVLNLVFAILLSLLSPLFF